MKRIYFVLLLVLTFHLAADLQQPTYRNGEEDRFPVAHRVYENNTRVTWEFVVEPTNLISNYYDYMPGSYNSTPVRLQPEAVGGGVYVTFHARENAASTRRVYYAYIDDNGNLTNVSTISTDDVHEGYSGVDVDPVHGDPIVSWHANIETGSADLEVVCTYDLFHLGSPGLWRTPFVIINDNTPSPNAPSDEFIWPQTYIGPSPITSKRRVYVVAVNSDSSPTGSNSENPLIAYADFDVNDFNCQSELNWTYITIPLMDDWHMGNPEWIRPSYGCAVSDDGKIAIYGYAISDGDISNTPDRFICFLNENYGSGDFTIYDTSCEFPISNPQNQDGTYRFLNDNGQPHDLYMEPYLCNHMNVIFADGGTKLKFPGNMNMMIEPASWYPDLHMNYPKIFTFDLITEEFTFADIHIPGANPYDNNPMIPWDLDEDGIVDEFDPDGYVTWIDGWSIYHYDNGVAYHENNYKITKNEDNGWLCAVWSDGLKSRLGNEPVPGYEDWAEFPEIAIAISADNGETWSETLLMNAKSDDVNYAPELDGMIPCYIYPGDYIEDIGNGYGVLHLFFLDDNSYGSSIQGHGENLGGTMIYTSIELDFSEYQGDLNANFSANPTIGTAPLSVQFNDLSTYITNPITTWEWDFESDGIIDSYLQDPSHIYIDPEEYTVTLTVSNGSSSNSDVKLDYITVINPVSADFQATPLSGYEPLEVQFTDQSTGNITSWEWDFNNDGVIDSYSQNPNRIYQVTGEFDVSLTVSDGAYSDTELKTDFIEVLGPSADFAADVTSGFLPLEVNFTDLSVGNISTWEWDFNNDGTIDSYEQNPTYTFNAPGYYDVSLTISNTSFSDAELKNNYIDVDGPTAVFTADVTSGYAPLEVQFTDTSQGNIESWEWDFENDGVIDSYEENPTHTYSEVDSFSVHLTIFSGSYSDESLMEFYIQTNYHVSCDFIGTTTSGLVPLSVQFTDLSVGSITQWLWDFNNDGIVDSNEPNPTCTYYNIGTYSVKLTTSDGTEEDNELKLEYISVTLTGAEDLPLPTETALHSNFPNPFNPTTYLSFDIKENESAQLSIYNLKGQIVYNEIYQSGRYHFPWNATGYSSGVYFYNLKSTSYEATKRMILLK
jgi:PKD repeat protein